MSDGALATKVAVLTERMDRWDDDWKELHGPKLEKAHDLRVWLHGLTAGVGAILGMVSVGLIQVFFTQPPHP